MFSTAVIRHAVKLQAREIGANVRDVIEDRARSLIEGVCGEHGFVRPGTLRMTGMSPGTLSDIDMGRSYVFDATFKAEVCNPVKGLRFNALVRSVNRFGALCEGGYYDPDNSMVPVIEVVIVRNPATIPNELDVGELQIGDEVGVEILGRNFDLRDTRISAFGRTVRDVAAAPAVRGDSIGVTSEPGESEDGSDGYEGDDIGSEAGSEADSVAGSEAGSEGSEAGSDGDDSVDSVEGGFDEDGFDVAPGEDMDDSGAVSEDGG